MKNIFKGIQITFAEAMIDNLEYNKTFDREGFRQHMLPAQESSVQQVERTLIHWLSAYGFKFEREFTSRQNGMVTMYISLTKTCPALFRDHLSTMVREAMLTSVIYGSMKADAAFQPSVK